MLIASSMTKVLATALLSAPTPVPLDEQSALEAEITSPLPAYYEVVEEDKAAEKTTIAGICLVYAD